MKRVSNCPGRLTFWCPGCEGMHFVTDGWKFNGDFEKPTLSPSVRVRGGMPSNGGHGGVCHFHVRNGEIQYLGDCTHALKSQTIAMVPPPS